MPFSLKKGKEADLNHTLVMRDHIVYGIYPTPPSSVNKYSLLTGKHCKLHAISRDMLLFFFNRKTINDFGAK